jgi:hypothetical protein
MVEPQQKVTLEIRILERVIETLGSERAASNRLRVPLPDLLDWIDGIGRPPREVFLDAVDFLIERNDAVTFPDLGDLEARISAATATKAP